MSSDEVFYLETVDTLEEAQAAQRRYVDGLSNLGLLPGPTVGYKSVVTATGLVYQLYMRAPQWVQEKLATRRGDRSHIYRPTSGSWHD